MSQKRITTVSGKRKLRYGTVRNVPKNRFETVAKAAQEDGVEGFGPVCRYAVIELGKRLDRDANGRNGGVG